MYASSWCSSAFLLVLAALPHLHASAAPLPAPIDAPALASSRSSAKPKKGGVVLPFQRKQRALVDRAAPEGDIVGGSIGLGDSQDLFYTVALTVGDSTTTLNLDTGSSDLWVMSTDCKTKQCQRSTAAPYDSKTFKPSGASVNLQYGDSTSGTHASGPVGYDSVTLAALSLSEQTIAAINDTDNSAVANGGAGILGLGFPSQSFVQAAAINAKFGQTSGTDTFVSESATYGPLVPRLIYGEQIDDPLFAITLQRNEIDVSGEGQITIGQLPDDVDESKITWVPVRLYAPSEGGMNPPSFAPNEVYPLRWEVELDAVFLDGKELPASTQPGAGVNTSIVSALIDTGNSLIRGPTDVVNNIMTQVSPAFAANSNANPTLPCSAAHDLVFQIGGKKFPVDARDFVSQNTQGDATTCIANNVVGTDAPSTGALFSWNLGDPFLKSNMVVFYYGNLTHPSVDPPRIGFMSLVPDNDDALLKEAVEDAQDNGGNFDSKVDAAPTDSSLVLESTSTGAAAASTAAAGTSSSAAAAPTTADATVTSVVSAPVKSSAAGAAPSNTASAAAPGARVWASSLTLVALSALSSLLFL